MGYDNGGQYAGSGIPRYEWIFGSGFVAPGGKPTTAAIAEMMKSRGIPFQGVLLDVGSGIGGPAFYMHDELGFEVIGVDLAPGMYEEAVRRIGDRAKVRFICGDAAELDIPAGSVQVVYSRDTLLHVADKAHMFRRIHGYLAPKGWCVFTDYAQQNEPEKNSAEFAQYVHDSGYSLPTLNGYVQILRDAGFESVELVDWTGHLLECLQSELQLLCDKKEEFVRSFSLDDFTYLQERWERKIRMVKDGSFKWPLIFAQK